MLNNFQRFQNFVNFKRWKPSVGEAAIELLKADQVQWRIQEDDRPPKTYEKTLFTNIFYNSENSIRDIRRFCRRIFCHSRVVTYTSTLSQ